MAFKMASKQPDRTIRIALLGSAVSSLVVNTICIGVNNDKSARRVMGYAYLAVLFALAVPSPCISLLMSNKIIFTIALNHVSLKSPRVFKGGLRSFLLLVLDTGFFVAFLTLLIANGITVNRSRYGRIAMHRAQMLVYNTFPWVVCA